VPHPSTFAKYCVLEEPEAGVGQRQVELAVDDVRRAVGSRHDVRIAGLPAPVFARRDGEWRWHTFNGSEPNPTRA
jgi:hypothetical protein